MSELDAQMQGLHPAWYDKKKEMDEALQGLTVQANRGAVSHERMQQVIEMSKEAAELFPEPRSLPTRLPWNRSSRLHAKLFNPSTLATV
jgi:putative SOS response-associated peptidase YedK